MATQSTFRLSNVIDPDKCLLEDFEIIAFERPEDSDLYSYWHDQFKARTIIDSVSTTRLKQREQKQEELQQTTRLPQRNGQRVSLPNSTSRSPAKDRRATSSSHKPKTNPSTTSESSSSNIPPPVSQSSSSIKAKKSGATPASDPPGDHARHSGPPLPGNGLSIINSLHYNTLPSGKVMAKYKLTKFYNKLRGRQMRRNLVLERHKMKKLDEVISKCQLNTWLAYTSLQALSIPGDNPNQLSTIAINNNPRLISIPQSQLNQNLATTSPNKKKKRKPTAAQQSQQQQQLQTSSAAPMHFVYIDPNDLVTYSNRICPQQIVEYKKRSHLLPSSATSKRSSAASYDVYEIMDVLANSDKNNVTITRNANRPAPAGCSIYSHSTNLNTRGIVSTQLHLQARTYLDSVGKFYAEERARLAVMEKEMQHELPIDQQISKYIKLEHAYSSAASSPNLDSSGFTSNNNDNNSLDQDDELERLEEEIITIVRPHDSKRQDSSMLPEGSTIMH